MSDRHPNHRPRHRLPVELRRTTVPAHVRAWITRATGRPVVAVTRLPGASSTAVHRIRFTTGAPLVLRRYVWPGFLEDEPDASQRELDALRFAADHAVPVPEVVAADVTGHDVGDGIPVLLMTLLGGRALAAPDPRRLAEVAASLHVVDGSGFPHRYFPWFEDVALLPPANAVRQGLWERALEVREGGPPPHPPTFIHRDFHPGNVLWSRGRCTGVVDWANACCGPPGCDVATCHGNLMGWAGDEVAAEFVAAYADITGDRPHPYWEVASVLEHGPSHWTPAQVALAERRLERALADLGAGAGPQA